MESLGPALPPATESLVIKAIIELLEVILRASHHIVEDKVYKYKSQLQQTGEG